MYVQYKYKKSVVIIDSHNAEGSNALFLLKNSFLSKVVSNGPV